MFAIRIKTALIATLILLSLGFIVNDLAGAAPKAKSEGAAFAGKVLTLAAPEGLARVDQGSPKVLAYLKDREEKMKFRVMAIYADPKEWSDFIKNLEAGRPAALTRYALVGSAVKVEKKDYNQKAWDKERKKYNTWFQFATNTLPITMLLNSKLNKKISAIANPNIEASFKYDHLGGKFSETPDSISFGARMDTKFYGGKNESYVAVSALRMGEKLFFTAYADSPDKVAELQTRSDAWRDSLLKANANVF